MTGSLTETLSNRRGSSPSADLAGTSQVSRSARRTSMNQRISRLSLLGAAAALVAIAGPAFAEEAAAPAAAAAAAPVSPINAGDTAWMLTSTALVLMMTIPGLALFYGGMVRKKNILATVMQSFAITCLVT